MLFRSDEVANCTRCALAQGRTQVVFGAGDPNADLMFVGEAPGFHEDQQGVPFVGQAGKLLERLLAGIGLERRDVYIANVIKCRPPGNRDPQPEEIEACESFLFRQVELIQPRVVATLGNFATKLLSGKPTGITRVHGQEQETTIGGRRVLSCLTLAVMTDGAEVTTIEGLARDGKLHPLQQAFIDHDAFQCGYCTPGQICSAVGLINEGKARSADEIRELMSGNICRCGAYANIVAAIQQIRKRA